MTSYLLIESQRAAGAAFLRDAVALARAGGDVRLVLVEDAVTAALPGAAAEVGELLAAAGRLWVDGFSLAQRGLGGADLVPTARPVDMAEVAAGVLEESTRVVWH